MDLLSSACIALLLLLLLLLLLPSIHFATKKRPSFMPSLLHKHFFITGGSSGIGLAIAKRAIQEDAVVTLISRNAVKLREAVEKLVKETQCSPDRIRFQAADVGDQAALAAAVNEAIRWKPIDVLVCNAGLTRGGYLDNSQVEDLEVTIRTNLNGTVYALHEALPSMKDRSVEHPVSVLLISSMASLYFLYGHAVYTATKYALRGLAEALRAELLPYNIKVCLLCPGFVNTPFLEDATRKYEITEIMKKVNLLDRKSSESPDSVAACAIDSVKRGKYLVVTQPIGFHLLVLGRGFLPADNTWTALLETALLVPLRLFSMKCAGDIRRDILQSVSKDFKR